MQSNVLIFFSKRNFVYNFKYNLKDEQEIENAILKYAGRFLPYKHNT